MKIAFNHNDIELYPTDNESEDGCEKCIFLRSITSKSYKCVLLDFEEEIIDQLFNCFESTYTPEPLSDVFKL